MRFLIALALMAAPAVAYAQMNADISDDATLVIDLPQGKVEITRNTIKDYGFFVHARGTEEGMLEGQHMPRWVDTYQDSALLRLDMATASCRWMYSWVTLNADGLTVSEEFGTCADEGTLTAEGDSVHYTMANTIDGPETITYTLDAKTGIVSDVGAPWNLRGE